MKIRDVIDPREFTYPSNMLTLLRLALLPFCIYNLWRPDRRYTALAWLSVAMFTDAIDGPIARMRGETSRLGEILDPIADKLLIDSTALLLSKNRGFPWWVTGLLLFRDTGIVLSALVVLRRHAQVTTAQFTGKTTTVALTAAMMLYLADGPRSGRVMLWLAMIPFTLSFWQYGRRFIELMRR